MKKLLLGVCLMTLGVACKTSGANMHDSSSCTGKDCAECAKQMENCQDCSAEMKQKCQEKCEGEVCPVTGKSIN